METHSSRLSGNFIKYKTTYGSLLSYWEEMLLNNLFLVKIVQKQIALNGYVILRLTTHTTWINEGTVLLIDHHILYVVKYFLLYIFRIPYL